MRRVNKGKQREDRKGKMGRGISRERDGRAVDPDRARLRENKAIVRGNMAKWGGEMEVSYRRDQNRDRKEAELPGASVTHDA